MKKNSWLHRKIEKLEGTSSFETERLLIQITEALVARLVALDLKKSDLAREMDINRAVVTRALSGDQNMTIRTMVSMATALGCRVRFEFEELKKPQTMHATEWTARFAVAVPANEMTKAASNAESAKEKVYRDLVRRLETQPLMKMNPREKDDGRHAAAA